MPCSAVTVDYRRDSAAMPVPISRSILEPEYSRLKYSSLNSSCARRPSGSTPLVSELVQKYSSPRAGLGSRSSSLTDDIRDRSQTRDTASSRSTRESSRSRTTSYSSESSTKNYRKTATNYTTFDLNEFRTTYAPSSYIAGTLRSDLSRPPRSSENLRTRASSTILREKRSEVGEGTNLEVISPDAKTKGTSDHINGGLVKDDKTDENSELSMLEVNSSALKSDDAPETNESADVIV